MSYANDPMGAALDRHITGNWGGDQFKGGEEFENICDDAWYNCVWRKHNQCPFDENCEESCLMVKAMIIKHDDEIRIIDEEMEQRYLEEQEERLRHPELF